MNYLLPHQRHPLVNTLGRLVGELVGAHDVARRSDIAVELIPLAPLAERQAWAEKERTAEAEFRRHRQRMRGG